jgi:hypothetical protein
MGRPANVSCESAEHYLPEPYVAAARATLEWIGTDPASSPIANRTIRAERIYTAENPGHVGTAPWHGPVLCNHPGSKDGSLLPPFWRKCVSHSAEWPVLWVGYSLEQLRRLAKLAREERLPAPSRLPMVVPEKRIEWATPRARVALSGESTRAGNVRLALGDEVLGLRAIRGRGAWAIAERLRLELKGDEEFDAWVEDKGDDGAILHLASRQRVGYPLEVLELPEGLAASPRRNTQPTHGNFFLLLGGEQRHREAFARTFGALGDYYPPLGRPTRSRDLRAEILLALHQLAAPGEEAPAPVPICSRLVQRTVRARRSSLLAELRRMHGDGLVEIGQGGEIRISSHGGSQISGTAI